MYNKIFLKNLLKKVLVHIFTLLRPNCTIICGTVSLQIFGRIPKSTTFSFDSNDLSIFKHTSNTHCVSNKWPIWTQKVQKEAYIEMWTTNFCNSFFKNIFLYIIDWLSKIRLVHTYVIHRKVCLIGSVYHLKFCRVSGIRRNKTKWIWIFDR